MKRTLNLWLVCLVGVDNRKVKMAFLLFVYLSFHRLCLSSQIGLDTIAGFRSFRKEVSLITCHAMKTTWKQRNPSESDQCCAPASNSGKRRESASTWLLSASIAFVLSLCTHMKLFLHLFMFGGYADTVYYHCIPLAVNSTSLQPSMYRVSLFDLVSIELQIFRCVIKIVTCFSH